jgi:hypothetical protein
MLDKLKGFTGQISTLASGAVDGVTTSVKDGANAVADKASGAVKTVTHKISDTAGAINDKVNDVATREAVAQLRDMMAIAVEELRARPIAASPVLLTAKIDVVLASLELQMMVDPKTELLHIPGARGAEAAPSSRDTQDPPGEKT